MKKLAVSFCVVVLLIAIGLIWEMRETLHSLQSRVDELTGQVAALQEQQQRFAELPRETPEPEDVTVRLAALAAEVAQLRNALAQAERASSAVSNQVAKARGEDIPFVYPDSTKRADYAFAGYDTPQSGFQSLLWAIRQTDAKMFLQSVTGRMAEVFGPQFAEVPEGVMPGGFRNGAMFKASGFRILEESMRSEDEMLLKVFLEGTHVTIKPVFKKVGGEWKWARNEL